MLTTILKRIIPFTIVGYAVAWTISYIVVMWHPIDEFTFKYYIEYFILAWTFRGLEIVAAEWVLSILIFVFYSVGFYKLVVIQNMSKTPPNNKRMQSARPKPAPRSSVDR